MNSMKRATSIIVILSFLWTNICTAAPEGGAVVAGNASISQQGNTTQITQTSQNTIINWHGFDTASHETVNFTQPNASAMALNRITSGLPTSFAGSLVANGQVWMVNPAGILFTSSSRINVAGLLATTLDINNHDFMNGNYIFTAAPGFANTSVINNGNITTVGDNGLVALVAPGVENNGVIEANAGKVVLASGTAVTLDLYGDELIHFAANSQVTQQPIGPNGQPLNNAVSNSGSIKANGGQVLMTANAAENIVQNVVSMSGVVEAKNAVVGKGGVIILGGNQGITRVSGKINSNYIKIKGHKTVINGEMNVPDNGFIETSGDYLNINQITLNLGHNTTWLIDPYNIEVVAGNGSVNNDGSPTFTPNGNSSQIGADLIQTQLNAGTDVFLNTNTVGGAQAGNITINAPITAAGTGDFFLIANNNIIINQPINIGGAFDAVSLGSGVITLNANVATDGIQTYQSPVQIGVASVSLNASNPGSVITFNSTIDSAPATSNELILLDDAVFNGRIGDNTPLGRLDALNSITTINTDSITADSQAYGFVNLTADTTLTASSGVSFVGTVNGAQDLTVNGIAGFLSNIGNTTPLNSLSISGEASFASSSIRTTGTQIYQSAVRLASPSVNIEASTATFNSSLDGSNIPFNKPDVTITGNAVFNGSIGSNITLNTLHVTGSSNINTASITTANSQTYDGAVQISENTLINPFGDVVTFNSTVDSAPATNNNLEILGDVVFNGRVGDTTPLGSMNFSGTTTINTDIINTALFQIYAAVNLATDTTLTTPSSITFFDAVNGAQDLTLNAATNFFNSSIGNITPLNNLFITGNTTFTNGTIRTTGTQTYASALLLRAASVNFEASTATFNSINGTTSPLNHPDVTITGNAVFNGPLGNTTTLNSLHVTGTTNINTNNITSDAAQTYDGPVTLSTNTALTASNIIFSSTVNSAPGTPFGLTLEGNAQFNDLVGNTTPLDFLFVNAPLNINTSSIISDGNQIYGDAVTLLANTTLTAPTVSFISTLDGAFDLTISAGGTHFNGMVGNTTPLNNLHVQGATDINAPITIRSSVSQIYDFNLTLFGDTTLEAPTVTLNAVDNALGFPFFDLTITGNAQLNGVIGNLEPLDNFHVTGSTDINTASIISNTSQTYDGAVTLSTNTALTATVVSFLNTLNGAFDLDILGTAEFNGTVGNITPLGTLSVLGTTNINTSSIDSTSQVYNDHVTLLANTTLTAPTITFSGNINGPFDLTLTGDTQFDGLVGNGTPLNNLVVNGITSINTPLITSASQTYNGLVSLLTSTTLTAPTITFLNTVNSAINGASSLTLADSSGTTQFNGTVGNTGQLNNLIAHSAVNINTSSIRSVNSQVYNNPITLLANTSLTSPSISLDTVDGAFNLQLFGSTTFNGRVGNTTPVGLLSMASGSATINTDVIHSTNTQTYNAVTLTADTTLTAPGVTFFGAVNGAHDLAINGAASFNNAIGNTTALNSLLISGNANFSNGTINTTGAQTYQSPILLSPASVNFQASTATFNNINGNFVNPDVTITGDAVFNGLIGNSTPLNSLHVTGSTDINTSSITSNSSQTYDGPVSLLSDTIINSALNTFNSIINGARNLVTMGTTNFHGQIGNVTPLASLTVTDPSTLFTDLVRTSGIQDYQDTLTLSSVSGNTSFEGSDVTFNGINAPANYTVTIAGDAQFDNNVTAGGNIHVTGQTTINTGSITSDTQTYDGLVILNVNSVLTATDILFNGGISGNQELFINATNIGFNFNSGTPFSVSNLMITGAGANNTLLFNTGNALQTWDITGTDQGNISTTGINGTGSFSNIQNIIAGNADDNFIFADTAKMTGLVNGNTGNDSLNYAAYGAPISVIMTDPSIGAGKTYNSNNVVNGQIDPAFQITDFSHFENVKGNGQGVFLVPEGKQNAIVITTPVVFNQPFVASGYVVDPMNFEDFLFFIAAADEPDFADIANIVEGINYPDASLAVGCSSEDCSEAEIITIIADSSPGQPVGNVMCLFGFAKAVDSTGAERILLPGDKVYADDKIVGEGLTRVKVHYNTGRTADFVSQEHAR